MFVCWHVANDSCLGFDIEFLCPSVLQVLFLHCLHIGAVVWKCLVYSIHVSCTSPKMFVISPTLILVVNKSVCEHCQQCFVGLSCSSFKLDSAIVVNAVLVGPRRPNVAKRYHIRRRRRRRRHRHLRRRRRCRHQYCRHSNRSRKRKRIIIFNNLTTMVVFILIFVFNFIFAFAFALTYIFMFLFIFIFTF